MQQKEMPVRWSHLPPRRERSLPLLNGRVTSCLPATLFHSFCFSSSMRNTSKVVKTPRLFSSSRLLISGGLLALHSSTSATSNLTRSQLTVAAPSFFPLQVFKDSTKRGTDRTLPGSEIKRPDRSSSLVFNHPLLLLRFSQRHAAC